MLAQPDPSSGSASRPRPWRWLKRVALSALACLLGYLVWVVAEREWTRMEGERELAEARASVQNENPTWEELNAERKHPPEGKNGAELISRIKRLMPDDWGRALAREEWGSELDIAPNVRYRSIVLTQVRQELERSGAAIALARTLRECPFGFRTLTLAPDVVGTVLNDTQHTRQIYDLLKRP